MDGTQVVANEMADLEAQLADLDLGEIVEAPEEEAEVEAAIEEIEEGDLEDLEADLGRQEAYATQTAEEIETTDPEAAVKVSKPAKAGKPRTPGAPRSASRDLATLNADIFVLSGDVAAMDQAAKDAAKTATIAARPTQVKIAEKFDNLFQSICANHKPSTYIMQAFNVLDKAKTMTSTDLVAAFKANMGEGTARSQAGQIMALFAAVKIADRVGQTLTLRDDSNVAEALRKLAGT